MIERRHWLTFVVPLAVYMIANALEPTPDAPGGKAIGLTIPYAWYPAVYTLKLALTGVAIALAWPGYREVKGGVSLLSILVGVVGVVVWVGLCKFDVEHRYLQPLLARAGLGWLLGDATRSAFDPFRELAGRPAWAWGFLAIRFLGLAAIVPLVEEFFLRGFLMRFVIANEWWKVPIGQVTTAAVIAGTVAPMLSHPGELLAAAVWFSTVTWLLTRTRSLWDCVAAHAVTNLLLGIYVVATGQWQLM